MFKNSEISLSSSSLKAECTVVYKGKGFVLFAEDMSLERIDRYFEILTAPAKAVHHKMLEL